MPIDRESGLDPAAKKVFKFLQNHPTKAFRPKEIAAKTGLDPATVFDRLVKMASSKGLVVDQSDGQHVYWRIK